MPVAPANVRKIAREALKIRESLPKSRQAGTRVGLARANQLASGENLSEQTLIRMRSYLLRAREDYRNAKIVQFVIKVESVIFKIRLCITVLINLDTKKIKEQLITKIWALL